MERQRVTNKVWFVDFSTTRGLAVARGEGEPCILDLTLREFVSGGGEGAGHDESHEGQPLSRPLPSPGDTVVLETNFEFHDDAEHNRVIVVAAEFGVVIRTLPLRVTGNRSRWMKIAVADQPGEYDVGGKRQSAIRRQLRDLGIHLHADEDLNAVEAIRMAYAEGQQLARPMVRKVRRLTVVEKYSRLRTGQNADREEPFIAKILHSFPSEAGLAARGPDGKRAVRILTHNHPIVSPKKHIPVKPYSAYSLPALIPMVVAATQSTSREEFDRMLGQYAHGYPSNLRSNLTRFTEAIAKRTAKLGGVHLGINPKGRAAIVAARRDVRWVSRYVYYVMKSKGV